MTSAKFLHFFTPSLPPFTVTNQLILFLSSDFGGPPPPTHCERHIRAPLAWKCSHSLQPNQGTKERNINETALILLLLLFLLEGREASLLSGCQLELLISAEEESILGFWG